MDRIEVRHAIPDDAEALTEATIRSIREICGASGDYTPEQIEDWVENKTPTNFLKWMANPELRLYAGLLDDRIAGVGMFSLEGEIELLYLVPEARGHGLGRALLAEIESEAEFLEISPLRLNATTVAVGFYERHGYRNLGPSPLALRSFKMEKSL